MKKYALILAGGTGTRMGKTKMPKQFLELGQKPIFVHTTEQFLANGKFDEIILCCHQSWLSHAKSTLDKYIPNNPVIVVDGGENRNESMINGCNYIKDKCGVNDDDIVVVHDAVRPFINQKIINDNIKMAQKYMAVDTVIPATDTIVVSEDEKTISNIPVRNQMYQGQTPQTFNLQKLMELYAKLTTKEKNILTDSCKIFVLKGEKVGLVMGGDFNMKITTLNDLKVANAILELRGEK